MSILNLGSLLCRDESEYHWCWIITVCVDILIILTAFKRTFLGDCDFRDCVQNMYFHSAVHVVIRR